MISKKAIQEFANRELDSFTWMKKLPREMILEELNRLKVRPVFKGHDRWTHQLVCMWIGLCCPQFMFLLDMGLGKTALLLDIITQLLREGKIQRGLITVPRLVNFDSWQNDTLAHSELELNIADGTIEEKLEALRNPIGDITVIDYHGLQLALSSKANVKGKMKLVRDDQKISWVRPNFQLFTMDETHKAKNKDTLRFSMLRQLTKTMDYRYGLTGTPFGRYPMDLWAQFFLIDRGATFGEFIGTFQEVFFTQKHNGFGKDYEFDKSQARYLYRCLQNRSIRYSEDEIPEIELPKKIERREMVKFADDQRQHYLNAVEGLLNVRGSKQELENAFLRLRQITSGYLSWKDIEDEKHTIFFKHNSKLDAVERIVDESGDSKLVISTEFTPSGRLVVERITGMGHKVEWLYGGSKDPRACVRRFKEDPSIKVLVMNSESGGTGTDGLQNVANYLVFYECPPSPITRKQTLKRVYRPGQLKRTFIIDIVMERSSDLRMLKFIEEGEDLHQSVVNGRIRKEDLI